METPLLLGTLGNPAGARYKTGTRTFLRRLLATATLGLLGTGAAQAQALNYAPAGASNLAGTYTNLATGTAITTNFGGTAINTDDDNLAAQAIGFTFTYNGANFTDFVMNTNGFLRLGTAAPSVAGLFYSGDQTNTVGATNSTDAADVNLLIPFNMDLQAGSAAGGADYRFFTTGTSPNQVCTIQWRNVQDKLRSLPTNYLSFAFQVKLYETSNDIEFVYSAPTASTNNVAKFAGVGIKGSGATAGQLVLASKSSGAAWSAAAFIGNTYSAAVVNSHNTRGTVPPDAGRTYRFTRTLANDAAVAAVYTLNKLPFPAAVPHVVKAVISNTGSAAYAGGTATLAITGPAGNAFTTTAVIPAIAIGGSTIVSFAGYTPTVVGTNTVTVSVPADDNAANNSKAETQAANTTDYSFIAPPGTSATSRGFASSANVNAFATKFNASATLDVVAMRAQLSDINTVGKTVYGVLFNPTTGVIIARSLDFIVPAPNVVDGTLTTFTFPAPITVAAGDFMVGVAQTYQAGQTTNYFPVAVQNDIPNRTGTFYTVTGITGTAPTAPTDQGTAGNLRFMMEAVTAPAPACAAVSSVAGSAITTTSANVTFSAPGGAVDYTVAYSDGTTTTTVGPNPTASPVPLSPLAPGTTYTVTVVSNCGGGLTSTTATGSFTTLPTTDAAVNAIYALGRLPIPYGNLPYVVSASVKNNGTTATVIPVTLTVTGPGGFTFTNTQTSASTPAGANNTVAFTGYTPTLAGTYTLTVTTGLSGDQLAGNSTQTQTQDVNATTFGHAVTGGSSSGALGFASAASTASFGSRFTTTANRQVTAINVFVATSGTMTGQLFSATGALLGSSPATAVTAGTIVTLTLTTPVTIAPGDFIAGVQITNLARFSLQAETPTRPATFYQVAGGTLIDQSSSNIGRFYIEAVTATPPPCGSVSGLTFVSQTDNSASIGFTAPVGSTVTNYTATLTQTVGGAVVSTQTVTASPVSFSGLISGTSYTIRIVTNCTSGGSSVATAASFTALTNLIVSTTTPISGSYFNVTVTGTGVASLSADLRVAGVLTLQSGSVYNTDVMFTTLGAGRLVALPGSTIRVNDGVGITNDGTGAFQLAGGLDFGTDANFIYGGTATQVTGPFFPAQVRSLTVNNTAAVVGSRVLFLDGDLSVRQLLRLQSGNLDPTGTVLTLLSSGGSSATVDNTGGVVTAPVTVQRSIDLSVNNGIGYRHFSSPVAAQPFSGLAASSFTPMLNTAYNGSATPYSTTPFPNVFEYNEARVNTVSNNIPDAFSKGWAVPTTANMGVGQGYTVLIPATNTVNFSGTLNNGIQTLALARTGGVNGGWQLVGNPYPAPLDYSLVALADRTGLDAGMYVFASTGIVGGNYRSYANGIGNPIIPLGQGFFVRVASGNPTGSLVLRNTQRRTTFDNTTRFQRGTADSRPLLALALANAAGLADQTHVYFEAGATAAHDGAFDAMKLSNPSGLNLATIADTEHLAINGLPLLASAQVLVPVSLTAPAAGSYTLRVDQLANFGTATVTLRDALTGTATTLTPATALTVHLSNGANNGRFTLVFNPAAAPLATAAQALAALVQVYPNPAHGTFHLTLPASAKAATVRVVNVLGQVVITRTLTSAEADFSTAKLAAGVYTLHLTVDGTAMARKLTVE